jgi:hypothetical protein
MLLPVGYDMLQQTEVYFTLNPVSVLAAGVGNFMHGVSRWEVRWTRMRVQYDFLKQRFSYCGTNTPSSPKRVCYYCKSSFILSAVP